MTRYSAPNGTHIELDDDTVKDLDALAVITRETTAALAARAVEALRRDLVPTATKARTAPPASTGARGRKAETSTEEAQA